MRLSTACSRGWRAYVLGSDLYDRNVIKVAMTRHTDSARLYVSKEAFPTFDAAVKTFAKERPKDLAVDYDEVAREADRLRREAAARQEVTRQEREQRRATERLGAGAALRAGDEGRADAQPLEPDPAQERVARMPVSRLSASWKVAIGRPRDGPGQAF